MRIPFWNIILFVLHYPFVVTGKLDLNNTVFGGKPYIQFHNREGVIKIGVNSFVGKDCFFNCRERIEIGRGCMIAPRVSFIDNRSHEALGSPVASEPIIIGDKVWIAAGAIILKGVRIGDNAVIGAGSVVTKNVPENSFVCGNPATVKRGGG